MKWYYWLLLVPGVILIVIGIIVLCTPPSGGHMGEGIGAFIGGCLLTVIGIIATMLGVIIGLLAYYAKIAHNTTPDSTDEPDEESPNSSGGF
jgi:hypothetical protein